LSKKGDLMSANPNFVSLVTEYGAANGLSVEGHAASAGLEFESGDRVVRILADPHDECRFCVELDVFSVPLDDLPGVAQSLLLMHRFNDHSRIVDGWLVSIDPDDVLVLSRSHVIDGVGIREIDQLIEAALDIADTLQKIWQLAPNSDAANEVLDSSRIFG
jgi:hypothetical protein